MLSAGCTSTRATRHEYVQLVMGVQVRLTVYTKSVAESAAREACRDAFERIAQIDEIMSDYRQDSELMRLCAKAGTGRVQASPELFEVLQFGQEIARQSDGAFDMTVGPYVALWRTARKTRVLPDPHALASAARSVGYQLMQLDPTGQTVNLTVPGMRLDLGGIAKGYAGDEALRILRNHGIRSAMYQAGGDIVLADPPLGKEGWVIETIDHRKMTLSNCAISTSGDTEQFVDIAGVRYSHVVDPHTGIGLTRRVMATVIAPRGLAADPLSKVVSILPEARWRSIVKRYHGSAFARKIDDETTSTNRSTTSETNP